MFQSVNVATIALINEYTQHSLYGLTSTALHPIQVKAVIFKWSYSLSLLLLNFTWPFWYYMLTIGCTVLCASYGITKLWFPHWSHEISLFQVEALLVGKYQVVQNEKQHFCKSTLSWWLVAGSYLLPSYYKGYNNNNAASHSCSLHELPPGGMQPTLLCMIRLLKCRTFMLYNHTH